MRSRISLTLLICMLGGLIGIVALFLPPRDFTPSSDYSPAAPTDTTTETGVVNVEIDSFAFSATGPVQGGQEVIVVNNDSSPHTLTADDGSFDTGLLQPGEQTSIVLPVQAGEYSFFCEVHPSMTGSFEVTS